MKSNINFFLFNIFVCRGSFGRLLFGYDAAVISGTISQVTVKFGLDEIQIGWFVGCALIGSIIGVLFAGKLSDMGKESNNVDSSGLFQYQVLAVHLVTLWNNWCLHVCWEV